MSEKIKLDILENATDSLNEALSKYEQGKAGNAKSYKFCIQHLSHFLELIFKYYVTQSHHLLIYKNPFAPTINEESQTIGLHEAINFLKNEGCEISEKFEKDIKWFKKLRNSIEHHRFEMDVNEVEEAIGRIMSAVVEFDENHESIDLQNYVSPEQYDLFHELANTYQGRLSAALAKVKAAEKEAYRGVRPKEYCDVHFSIHHCYECDHETMIPDDESSTGYKCTFCGNEESEDIEVTCDICGSDWPGWQMSSVEWTDEGDRQNVCPYCSGDPEYRNDD